MTIDRTVAVAYVDDALVVEDLLSTFRTRGSNLICDTSSLSADEEEVGIAFEDDAEAELQASVRLAKQW
jgi:hypothetical protein